LLVLALTHSATKAGATGAAATLPYLLFNLPAGGLIDRWDRKRTMLLCEAGRAVALASIPVAGLLGNISFPQILAAAFVDGTGFVFFSTAQQAALPNVVATEQLPRAIAYNEAQTRGATLAGQPIGGILFGLSRTLPFLADAISYVVSFCTLLFVAVPFQQERAEPSRRLDIEIKEGLLWLWRQPFLRVCALLVSGSNFIFQALTLVTIVLAAQRGATPGMIGIILGVVGAGGLLGAVAAGWVQNWFRPAVIIIGICWLWAVLLPLYAVRGPAFVLGVLFGLMAFAGPAWNVVVGSYGLALVPDELRGRVGSAAALIGWGAMPLGSLAAGFLITAIGGTRTSLVLAAGMLLIAIVATTRADIRHVAPLSSLLMAPAEQSASQDQ
jgi:predicted MFS family arabinose efflux permease